MENKFFWNKLIPDRYKCVKQYNTMRSKSKCYNVPNQYC